jgi:16S rRNA (adenine1518-N6/adenine1519-N6)-dimethyltransferase
MMPTAPRPRKRLGQHFLIDPNIVRKIVTLADVRPHETVLEIGPGRGVLTRPLCAAARTVIAIEKDPRLGDYLTRAVADCRNLDLRVADALEFPFESLPDRSVVVANLPYNISTPLLFRLLEARERIDRMVLMLQTEVARRLVARPGGRDYGILSVLAQYSATPSLAFQVAASCFRPRPEVGSAVVRLMMQTERSSLRVADEALFVRTVRAAFAHRRKTLLNSLRDEGLGTEAVAPALARVGIAPSRRAETLALEEFAALADAMSKSW